MSAADRKPLSIDATELGDAGEDLEQLRANRAAAAEIRTAAQRLEAWAAAGSSGAVNVITVDGVSYSWDAHPRKLQNGALQGRVYAQRRGETPRDIGGFKIDAHGRVINIPGELAGVLPGTDTASSEDPQ